jgi:hypothetical protein
MHVVLGRGANQKISQRYLAFFRKVKGDFQSALADYPSRIQAPVTLFVVTGRRIVTSVGTQTIICHWWLG